MQFSPNREKRVFRPGRYFKEIDFGNFDTVIKEYEQRIQSWYIDPAEKLLPKNDCRSNDFGFAVLTFALLLIDTMSQYEYGELSSSKTNYKKWLKNHFSSSETELNPAIIYNNTTLENIADILYHGFRCGILHEAHVPIYGVINADEELPFKLAEENLTYTQDDERCETLIVNPYLFFKMTVSFFKKYINELKNPSNSELRSNFKKKFKNSFGISITG